MKGLTAIGSVTAKVAIVVAAALGGTALVSSSVFASLTATASNTSGGSIETGTLKLTQAASGVSGITGGFSTAISNVAPGDTVNRYIDLTNGGTLDGDVLTLAIAASPSNALTTNGTAGLQVTIKECAVAWTSAGVCTPGATTVLASSSLLSLATAKTLAVSSLAASAVNHLQFSINLPAGSEVTNNGTLPAGTVQGLTTAVTWNFLETLRTNTITNS
jgi:spore coat-associated protein N